jgi:hypothetical protein
MNPEDFTRLANNFYISKGLESHIDRIALDAEFVNYYVKNQTGLPKSKVAFVFICLNPLYWQYAPEMVAGAKKFFLPGHNTDFFFWTDIPETGIKERITEAWKERGQNIEDPNTITIIDNISNAVADLRGKKDINLIPTEPVDWPYPTLLRYNLFLQQEEKLKEYDYIFYLDIDMQFFAVVGDEILPKEGIMGAVHPMYHIRKEYWPPYEPNENSASFIKRPGQLITDNGKPRFMPLYFAGGFQGGKSEKFIEAMKATKKIIDKDLAINYIPIWNDETAWNKYLSENPPEIVLSPSYIYPDSLIKEYYEPLWGCSYQPKIKTLTKWFSTSKEGGEAVAKMIKK